MTNEKSYARLGLFVVVTLVVVLATAAFFIQRLRSREAIAMVTYTREDVSGLDISSPVRLNGVPVGQVTDLRVGVRRKTIEIDFDVFLDRLSDIGLDVKQIRKVATPGFVFPSLRSRIVANPVSGQAYLLLEQPENPPPPMDLGFTPTRPYVPSMPSITTTVQDKLPALLDRTGTTLQTLQDAIARIPVSLDRSDRFFANLERIMQQSQLPETSSDSRKFFAATTTQIEQMSSDLDKFSDDARAALKEADLPTTTQSTRDAAESSRLAADDLRRTLPALRDSLEQMRELPQHLYEQPESVVYGPRPQHEKH